MTVLKFTIDSIFKGQSPVYHGGGKGQFLASQGIDPETSLTGRPSGHILPVSYSTFSGGGPSGAPNWLMASSNPNATLLYAYMSDGELISYNNVLAGETVITGPTSGAGNGATTLNDNILLATPTDVSYYGQLSGTPAMNNTWWTSTLSLTALTNTVYPQTRNLTYPNHAMHVHGDSKAYFCDFKNNIGMIHKAGITSAGANDGSAYNVLDLPNDIKPFDIESYGTDLAIIGSSFGTATSNFKQGESFLFLWDTFSDSFYRQIPIPKHLATAILNVNGELYIWAGTIDTGYQILKYDGAYGLIPIFTTHEGSPPSAGAVDVNGNRISWGSQQSLVGGGANVFTLGYTDSNLPRDAVNNIAIVSEIASGDTNIVSALKYVQNAQTIKYPVVGWRTSTNYGLSKVDSTATKQSFFRTMNFEVPSKFKVRDIRIPLTGAVDSNTVITPTLNYDNASSTGGLTAINNTNYPSEREVNYKAMEIESSMSGAIGKSNFDITFSWTGSSTVGLALPIEIIVETIDS